jgi:hypothetical protein
VAKECQWVQKVDGLESSDSESVLQNGLRELGPAVIEGKTLPHSGEYRDRTDCPYVVAQVLVISRRVSLKTMFGRYS